MHTKKYKFIKKKIYSKKLILVFLINLNKLSQLVCISLQIY